MKRQIFLDTETTGLDPLKGDRIIEIAALEMVDRQFTGNKFHTYINPQRDISAAASAIHGLTEAFLSDKPVFSDMVHSFLRFVQGAELIIHNASFDTGFINHEFQHLSTKPNTTIKPKAIEDYCIVSCSLKLARKKHPGQKNSLDALCKRYGINNAHRKFHGALLDTELLALVYLAMTDEQESLGFVDLTPDNMIHSGFNFPPTSSENLQKPREVSFSPSISSADLIIHHATQEEEKTHAFYLQKMYEQCKVKPLWLEDESKK